MSVVSTKRFPNYAVQARENANSLNCWIDITTLKKDVSAVKLDDNCCARSDGEDAISGKTWVIRVNDFGFYIPSYAIVKGIEVKIDRNAWTNDNVTDEVVSLIINGVKIGDNKADTINFWPTSAAVKTYGSPTDLWGLDLTSDSFNKKFGVEFQADEVRTDYLANIDYIAVIIYFDNSFPQPKPPEYTALDQSDKVGKKTWFARIYDIQGNFKSEITMDDFKNFPEFSNEVNDYASEIRLELNHKYDDLRFPESGSVVIGGNTISTYKGKNRIYNGIKPGYFIKFFVSDKEIINKQIYSGIISGIKYDFNENNESLEVNIVPYSSLLNSRILRNDEGSTIYSFSNILPRDMITDIFDNSGLTISYDTDTMKDVDVRRSYDFNVNKISEAVKRVVELCPHGWYSYIDGKDYFHLKKYPTHSATHIIHKKNVQSFSMEKSMVGIVNRLYFLGGGTTQLFKRYDKDGSQKSWGLFEEIHTDERVTDEATAEYISKNKLSAMAYPTINFMVEIMDSNFAEGGYDIESINLGDILVLTTDNLDKGNTYWNEFYWGQDYWGYGINSVFGVKSLIKKIEYRFNSAIIHCSFSMPLMTERIEDINKDIIDYRTKDAPELVT